jgi:hypothetical protein
MLQYNYLAAGMNMSSFALYLKDKYNNRFQHLFTTA